MAHAAKTGMSMNNLNLLAQDDVAKDGEEGEDGWECRFSVDDEERYMVDLKPIRQVSYPRSPFVCMCDDDDLVTSIDQLGGKLVDVRFDSPGLGEEEVADHGNVVRHFRRDLFMNDGSRP